MSNGLCLTWQKCALRPNEAEKTAGALCLERQKCALSPKEAVKMASALCLERQKCAAGPNEAVKIASVLCLKRQKCAADPNEAVKIAGNNNILKRRSDYNLLKRLLQKRLSVLQKNVSLIKLRIDKYPQGYLKINKKNGEFYYRIVSNITGERRYIRKENINEAKLIAQRDYDNEYLKYAEKEINELRKQLKNDYSSKARNCYSSLHPGRKCLVEPLEVSDEEYINKWMSKPYVPKGFKEEDNTEYYTENGERVRSKSEVIIANTLKSLNIPYKYECPLKLNDLIIYPDFTILDVKRRQEKYLEHFGMMGDLDYVSNMMLKIATYEQNNIFIGDRLICTFESIRRPLSVSVLRNKLNILI